MAALSSLKPSWRTQTGCILNAHSAEQVIRFYNTGDRIRVWGKRGAFWGAALRLLVSPALFFLPVVGHVLILGPLASIGVAKGAVIRYETAIAADKSLLVAHGTPNALRHAHEVLRGTESEEMARHADPSSETTRQRRRTHDEPGAYRVRQRSRRGASAVSRIAWAST